MDRQLTAYCGLCCADCIPSDRELFALADGLRRKLGELRFEHYARHKSRRRDEFRHYARFLEVLDAIGKLECPAPCRGGGGAADCGIKRCVRDRGWEGCWECADRRQCALLGGLRQVHPHLDAHLDLIAELGPYEWFGRRLCHYLWQTEDERAEGAAAERPDEARN